MDHIAHLRKQFNQYTYDYIITLIKRRKKNIINFMRLYWFFIETNLNPTSPKDALLQVWLKLGQWFWRIGFFNFVNVFSAFRIISPWKRVGPFLNKLKSPSPKDALCQIHCNWLCGSGERKKF